MPKLGVGEKFLCGLFIIYLITKFLGKYATFGVLFVSGAVQFYIWYRKCTFWQRMGVPSPPAWPLFGNMFDYGRKGMHQCDLEWTKKYGSNFGAYMLTNPEIIVSDRELLKKILVKDFHNFTNRREFFDIGSEQSISHKFLIVLRDEEWKNTRHTITPAFTSGKLRNIVHLMEKCIGIFLEILEENSNEVDGVDVKKIVSNLTLDIVAAAAFAIDTDTQRNPDNEFSKFSKIMTEMRFSDWQFQICVLFPWITSKLESYLGIEILATRSAEDFFVGKLMRALKERRQNPMTEKLDFLQLLINTVDQQGDSRIDFDSSIDSGITPSKSWTMTDIDIIAQSFLFLIAGQETTSNTITFAMYLLAMHPNIQDRVFNEITSLQLTYQQSITYDHVQHEMPYLDAVLTETLRLYPPGIRLDRECKEDYQLTDQILIPKGAGVDVPVFAIHHSEVYYENAEKFDPERWLHTQIDPYTYLPFGFGPRSCIGMRFAQLELRLVISNVIRKFSIQPTDNTPPIPLDLEFTTAGLKSKKPIILGFRKRSV